VIDLAQHLDINVPASDRPAEVWEGYLRLIM